MKQLQKTFDGIGEVRGVTFTQLKQGEKAFIYSRSDGYYEVFKRIENKRFDCISYPKSASFGLTAWCFSELEKANRKFDDINIGKNTEN